jgi:hypothetical protein
MNQTDLARTVEELQERVAALEKRSDDLALKAQMTNQIFRFRRPGLIGTFGPEFSGTIMEVGLSECSKRCIKDLQEERAAIAANTSYTDEQRLAAYERAADRAAACHEACAARFPIIPG